MKFTRRKLKKSFVSAVAGICSLMLLVPTMLTSSTTADEFDVADNTMSHVRVGLNYSTSAVKQCEFTTEYGIEYGIQDQNNHTFIPLGSSEENLWSVENDSQGYYIKLSYVLVGDKLYAESNHVIDILKSSFTELSDEVFIQYNSDGANEVRIGSFGERSLAEAKIASMKEQIEQYNAGLSAFEKMYFDFAVVNCNKSCIKLVENGNRTVCGYIQNDENFSLAARACQPDDGSIGYIYYSGRIYEGVFEFRKLAHGSYSTNITVINVVEIERYIGACMSYEIYPSWSHQSHRMFAIVVRTYIYGQIKRHASWNFNLCSTTHCQMYRGFDRVNQSLMTAAEETKGLVVADAQGELAHIYYSASSGGCSVAGVDAWGGADYSYSKAVAAPWENYKNSVYSYRTKWTVQYSPYQLYLQVRDTCPELKGSIVKIETTLCTNSPYVYSITMTDLYGNTSTVSKSTAVSTLLGLNSANFVVGKAGSSVERVVYSLDCFESIYYENPQSYDVIGFEGNKTVVVTSKGEVELKDKNSQVVSADGVYSGNIFDNRVQIVMSDKTSWFTEDGMPDVLNAKTVKTTVMVDLEGKDGYYVFDGMGWGHGIGLSQYGSNDMIELGFSPETVLRYYLPGTRVIGINQLDNNK